MRVRNDAIYRRRRRITLGAVALVAAGSLTACFAFGDESAEDATSVAVDANADSSEESQTDGSEGESSEDADTEEAAQEPTEPSDQTMMEQIDYITGDITPKSVVANGHGLVIANNMMYSHSTTVYDSASHELVATMSDNIDMSEYGIEGHPGSRRALLLKRPGPTMANSPTCRSTRCMAKTTALKALTTVHPLPVSARVFSIASTPPKWSGIRSLRSAQCRSMSTSP
ncbi:hypothetical protein [Ornithinimicrobium sp. INDO-MA30-4]|uniref:hypothetical protein n=1 Tax=Ornithinimicrobium sp. INDO-MA30-4 TaxID=2908651 RepID=UPI001F1C9BE3|nr:hypothetical protein [Ornithinimicrobium sp. INDO-MA30-4]UJH71497.1 hypothetical protein L0A91_07410 [Ornithinimicrobium sp. INDO-MA30-4]